MYKVTRGLVTHKGEVYRKGAELPETFTNKEGYSHVEWKGKGTGPTAKDKVAENAQIKKLQKQVADLKAENAELKAEREESKKSIADLESIIDSAQ